MKYDNDAALKRAREKGPRPGWPLSVNGNAEKPSGTKKLLVTSTEWKKLSEYPVCSVRADHRLAIDIDARGHAWARIARGNDKEVEVEVEFQ